MSEGRKLKTLEESDAEAHRRWEEYRRGRSNGIKCPKCPSTEMHDSSTMLTCDPPRVVIYCPECNYQTSRVA